MIIRHSFFRPHRLLFDNLEAATASTSETPDNIGDILIKLEKSQDAELLRDTLVDWLDSLYPGLSKRLHGESIGTLLEAAVELEGVDENLTPAEMVTNVFERAFDEMDPLGDETLKRMKATIHTSPSPRPETKEAGNELIDQSEELTSPRLTDLRRKLRNLQTQYDTYLEVSNKAAVKLVKREIALKKFLEGQGFHYSAQREGKAFYYFDKNYTVFIDERAPELPATEQDQLGNLIDAWRSMGQHYDRSSRTVDRYEADIKKVEAQIKAEEEKVRQSS